MNPEQLNRLLEALPFKDAAFTVQRGQDTMKLVVPRDEVMRLRGEPIKEADKKSEKPSLLNALEINEQKSKQQFGQRPEPGRSLENKNKREEI